VYDHGVRWPWQRREAAPTAHYAPVASYLEMQGLVDLGASVTEQSVLQLSPFYRAVSLIAGQLAGLDLNTFTGNPADRRRVPSIFDDPDPNGQPPFAWKETLFLHLLIHGRTGALIQRNDNGGIAALPLSHPSTFRVRAPGPNDTIPPGGLFFDVATADGKVRRGLTRNEFWYVPGMSLNGIDGVSLIQKARLSLQTTTAADRAAGRMFSHGAMIGGFLTPADPDEDIEDDLPQIQREIGEVVEGGWRNAGRIPILNQRLKMNPWTMTSRDAEFLSSRQFQIEEVSRWTGVPPHLLMQTEKQTSWGTGVEEQNRALGRSVLDVWSNRLEAYGSLLLARPRFLELDFSRLERSSPDREQEASRADYEAGLITLNEARARRGLPPMPGGDVLKAAPAPDDGSAIDA
jgi:HK97 family phage portal protein